VNPADDYDAAQPTYDKTGSDITDDDDVTNKPLLSDEDYEYLFGKDEEPEKSELYDDYVEEATTPPDTIKQPSKNSKPTLVQPNPSNILLKPSKLAETTKLPNSGVEKSKIEPEPVDPTVVVPVVAAVIILCCAFLSVVIMYCFKIYSVKKSVDDDKPQEVYENKLCGQQRYTDKPISQPSNQIVPSNQQPSIDTVATQPQPEVTKQPLLHKNSTTSLLTNESVRGRGSISSTITEDPVQTIDISMAHTLLTYMESITSDKLNVEWNQLEEYVADNVTTDVAESNMYLNRNNSVLPFDHNRVLLDTGDYINASYIIDKDPRNPRYITSQAPTNNSVIQTWQLIWQHNITCIVLLTPLSENSTEKCAMYWPCESTMTFGCFEVHLISEHILSEDYVVRSLFVRNTESGHSRTITQFHYLSWPSDDIPSSADQLLDMRRKAAKCSLSSNNPVLVQCDDGSSRSGSYILIDVVLNNLQCSNKHEVDVSSTVEHLRDQRMNMVNSKEQFQFALNAVAEEVNTILKNLLKNDA